MVFYSDKNRQILVTQVANYATPISSVTNIVKDYILSLFPNDRIRKTYFFRSVNIDTALAFMQQQDADAYYKGIPKKPYPNMSISPSISMNSMISGTDPTSFIIRNPSRFLPLEIINQTYPILLETPDEKIRVYYSQDYITIILNFTIKTNTYIQNMNIGYYVKSRLDDRVKKYINNQCINSEIPNSVINVLARSHGWFKQGQSVNANNQDMMDLEIFLAQTGKSRGRIKHSTDLTTGKDRFFFGQQSNILTEFDNFSVSDGVQMNDKVESEYSITFSISCSFWCPNSYIVSVDKELFRKIQDTGSSISLDDSDNNGAFYTMTIYDALDLDARDTIAYKDNAGNVQVGQLVLHKSFAAPVNSDIPRINFGLLLQPDLIKLLEYAKYKNIDISNLLYVRLRSMYYKDVVEGKIDYERLCGEFDSPIDSDIVLDVFINRAALDSIVSDFNNDTFFKLPNALGTLTIAYYENEKLITNKVKIYKFMNDSEMNTEDISKSLRVMTPSGIGYIGLVNEGSINASNYKICLGKNKYGTKIIKCLEIIK